MYYYNLLSPQLCNCPVGNVLFDVDVFSDSYVDVWFSRRINHFIGFAS